MKIYTQKELRGGITLKTRMWRWGYIHLDRDPGLETGSVVIVGCVLYVVTCIRYIRYQDGRIMISISLMRFRWTEISLFTVASAAVLIVCH